MRTDRKITVRFIDGKGVNLRLLSETIAKQIIKEGVIKYED